jgi:hypothetical protein
MKELKLYLKYGDPQFQQELTITFPDPYRNSTEVLLQHEIETHFYHLMQNIFCLEKDDLEDNFFNKYMQNSNRNDFAEINEYVEFIDNHNTKIQLRDPQYKYELNVVISREEKILYSFLNK